MHYKILPTILLFGLVSIISYGQDIRINEIVSSNSTFEDEDQDTPDWLELYNFGSEDIQLQGWSLTDDIQDPQKWQFPSFKLDKNAYLLVFASDKDRVNVADRSFHTNFKIASAGETIYLYDAANQLVDSLQTFDLPSDVSYGINEDGNQCYFEAPTPNASNDTPCYLGNSGEKIIFSKPSGTTTSFNLVLSTNAQNAVIRYTTNSFIPTASSEIYTDPIPINKNTVVRARLFETDKIPGQVYNETYTFERTHELPIVYLVTEPPNFFDNEIGIHVLGDDYDEDVPFFGANFWKDWERPIHFKFQEADGNIGFELDAGVKINGGWSRAHGQKSLAIFARKKYGVGDIKYPVFEDVPYDEFESIILRNSGNDWLGTNIRDVALTGLMKGSGVDYSEHRTVVTYLNGIYWGIYNIREKMNEHFLASKHNIDADIFTILEHNSRIVQGSNVQYDALTSFFDANTFEDDANYEFVKEKIDIDNFIKYQLFEIYIHNKDWPGNNIKYWKIPNGKWKWILFDTDFGFGNGDVNHYKENTLFYATEPDGPGWPNPPWGTLMLRKLLQNDKFKIRFINQFADELNSRFLPERVSEHLDSLIAPIASEVPQHFERWLGDLDRWNRKVNDFRTYGNLRQPAMKDHIKEYFNLPDYHQITIENDRPDFGYVVLNSLNILDDNWSGDYFETIPIKLTAIAKPGRTFSHWEGDVSSMDAEIIVDMNSAMTIKPIFEQSNTPQNIIINEINFNSPADHNTDDWLELYNPQSTNLDLTGWSISDSDDENAYYFPPQTHIAANGYLVLCKDTSQFRKHITDIPIVKESTNLGFSSTGDEVRLQTAAGQLHDIVTYSTEQPWPDEANGNGFTLELIEPGLNNENPENWHVLNCYGSPGRANVLLDSIMKVEPLDAGVYPNPFKDFLTIVQPQLEDLNIKIFNISGQLLFNQDYKARLENEIFIETSDFPPCVYLVRVTNSLDQFNEIKCIKY